MMRVRKKKGKTVKAWRLSEKNRVIKKLIVEKKVIPLDDGRYEVFSREAVRGNTGHGQLAQADDYVKIDSEGFPYPNGSDYFEKKHRKVTKEEYEQILEVLNAWTVEEPMCPEVLFLIREKGLVIEENCPDKYYSARLWGTKEAAAKDAVILFYSISYREDGSVQDAEFNFVEREEFDRTYEVLEDSK